MSLSKWIMSNGGPLICMEQKLEGSWGGTEALSIPTPGLRSDYDRICQTFEYIYTLPVAGGQALALGELTLDTTFWRSRTATLFLVQVATCEEDFDLGMTMSSVASDSFDNTCMITEFVFSSADIVVFDSAERGSDAKKPYIGSSLHPGTYIIRTRLFDADPTCSLLLHRFDKSG